MSQQDDMRNTPPPSVKPEARPAFASAPDDNSLASHPVGAAAGAVGGAMAGAVAGLAAGPVGSLAGAAVGAALGSGAASGNSRMMAAGAPKEALADDPDHENYWRQQHTQQAYAGERSYDDYAPAYRYGAQAAAQHGDRPWNDVEPELSAGWSGAAGASGMDWETASPAVRAAMERRRG